MRVVCPACDAAYEVPAPVVEAGRTVRCARCGAQFPASGTKPAERRPPDQMQPAPPAPAGSDAVTVRADEAARLPAPGEMSVPASGRRVSPAVLGGWALSLAVLAAGAGAALAWRQQIMHAWPPSTRAYAALGYRP